MGVSYQYRQPDHTFGNTFLTLRSQIGLTQKSLATMLGVSSRTIQKWESGSSYPKVPHLKQFIEVCINRHVLAKRDDVYALWLVAHQQEPFDEAWIVQLLAPQEVLSIPDTVLPTIWMIPYARNPFFLGRDDLLSQISAQLRAGQTTALSQPQALSGLGGIGKTQIAVEYAYRHAQEYQIVLWARAESTEALHTSYSQIATTLNLPEKEEKQQENVVKAVKTWLQRHQQWLLILDNADELALLKDFLPSVMGGHLLITTRTSTTGRIAKRLEVETFSPEQGTLFLLRRASLLATDAPLSQARTHDHMTAQQIVHELGGLPLALDQAGAYIDETRCSLDDYLTLYQTHQDYLLKHSGMLAFDYPQSVASTWSLSFERVEQANPIAADLLRFCAFLSPDAIPEEIITKGSIHLGPLLATLAENPLVWNKAILSLRAYSLLNRNPQTHTLSVHRLVQAVLRDSLTTERQQEWKRRTILALHTACPDIQDIKQWDACERWLPHAFTGFLWIKQEQIATEEAASLLDNAGLYLHDHARYTEAEPLFLHTLSLRERSLGSHHSDVAHSLNRLAILYYRQGKYAEAESLHLRSLHIWEQSLGPDHPDIAYSLNGLANLYQDQGKCAEAEPLFLRALHIREHNLGPDHPDVAHSLNNLADVYQYLGKDAEAEPLFLRSLHILEINLGPSHPQVAYPLNNLAILYYKQRKYAEAEPLFLRAIHIWEQSLGSDHPQLSPPLNNLAALYFDQRKYTEAEPLFLRALHIWEQSLGPDHPGVAHPLDGLATLYTNLGKYAEAEPLFLRALHILELNFDPNHHITQIVRADYALLLQAMKQDKGTKEPEEKV